MASVDQPLLLAPAAFIVVDLVEGTEPLLNSFVVRSSECGVFHTGQMQEFVQKIASHQAKPTMVGWPAGRETFGRHNEHNRNP